MHVTAFYTTLGIMMIIISICGVLAASDAPLAERADRTTCTVEMDYRNGTVQKDLRENCHLQTIDYNEQAKNYTTYLVIIMMTGVWGAMCLVWFGAFI